MRPTRRTLDPFVSHLLLEGATGTVVLVDEATGWVVAKRSIAPPDPVGEGLAQRADHPVVTA